MLAAALQRYSDSAAEQRYTFQRLFLSGRWDPARDRGGVCDYIVLRATPHLGLRALVQERPNWSRLAALRVGRRHATTKRT